MGCNEFSCGTGLGSVVLPGDPSNNSILSAVPEFGGVTLSWSYPTTNPYAVAYVEVYRSISSSFLGATYLNRVSASFYFDAIPDTEIRKYYYWIVITSVNGTVGDPIGPASATPRASIEKTMLALTEKIDAGMLATSLRTEIDRITGLASLLDSETEARTLRDQVVAEALKAIQSDTGKALTYIAQETINRQTEDEALINSVDLIAAGIAEAQAAILNEQAVRVTKDTALAQQINQAEISLGDQVAAVQTSLSAEIDQTKQTVGALWTAKMTVNGLVGGFGLSNNGSLVEAGFDVDRFWVGRTKSNKIKPFIIDGGITYINDAAINKLTFSKLRDETGSLIVTNGKVQAKYIHVDQLAVNAAQITDGTLNSARIGQASIDTLHIAGEAVTVPRFFSGNVAAMNLGGGGGIIMYACDTSNSDRICTFQMYVNGSLVHTQSAGARSDNGSDTDSRIPVVLIYGLSGSWYDITVSVVAATVANEITQERIVILGAKR